MKSRLSLSKEICSNFEQLQGRERLILNAINMLHDAYLNGKIANYDICINVVGKADGVELSLITSATLNGMTITIGNYSINRFTDAVKSLLRSFDELKRLSQRIDMLNLSFNASKNHTNLPPIPMDNPKDELRIEPYYAHISAKAVEEICQ